MISAAEAFAMASAASEADGRGRLDPARYAARPLDHEGRSAWFVGRNRSVLGQDQWFVVDRHSGAIIQRGYRGPR